MAINPGYTRRCELTCTLSEMITYGSVILYKDEVIYVKQNDGRYAIKIGDGVTALADLPYVVNYSEINDLKIAAESAKSIAEECAAQALSSANSARNTVQGVDTRFSNPAVGTLCGKAGVASDVSPLLCRFNISLKGESAQASEPTLELPVEVVNCENPTLKIFRKNLLKNPDSVTSGMSGGVTVTAKTDGSLTLDGMVDESKLNNSFCLYKNDTTPLITLRAGVAYRARLLDEQGNNLTTGCSLRVAIGTSYSPLFTQVNDNYTPAADTPIYGIFLYLTSSIVGTTFTNKVIYPILEVVGESDEYDEYSAQSVTIPLTLAGQGDYKDEIVVDRNTNTVKHTQRYYKYEFTGEETWNIMSSSYSVDTTLARLDVSIRTSTLASSIYVNYQLCNAVPCVMNYSQDTVGVYATAPSSSSSTQIFARIPTVDATSADFNEVFKSGTYLWYPMANPIETDYTDTEWGQALLALVSDGETLTFDCDAETVISYNKDINKVIQKLTDAIIALGGTI